MGAAPLPFAFPGETVPATDCARHPDIATILAVGPVAAPAR